MAKEFKISNMVDTKDAKQIEALASFSKSEIDNADNVGFFTRIIQEFIPDFLKSTIVPIDTYFDKKKSQLVIKFRINDCYDVEIVVSCDAMDDNDTYVHYMKIKFPDGVVRKITYESTNCL
jgi:hypothetical protein